MTLLSVVVPVYKVQGYLRQCLDSVLGQTFTDLELIAVDDCSPDGSGRILAEYAARDPRVRVVTLEQNVGLGRARNIGLDHAVGDYVWFLDSDDWLEPGSLAAVARRLRETGPEMLLVDWDRVYWNGQVIPGTARRLLPKAPDVFSVEQWPKVVDVLHVAWNKIIRRDVLVRMGFRFEQGWYEDVSFTYPVLSVVQRISTLPRVCVHYRQRRTGAITRTVTDRHFEIFDHWERAFALVDEYSDRAEALRPLLFKRMVWHYLSVLNNAARVPRRSRKAFFARMHEHYRRYLPTAGYPVPKRVEGVRHRLVARNSFRTFEVLRRSVAVAKQARQVLRRGRRRLRQMAVLARRGLLAAYYRVQLRLPIDGSLALYASYWYRGASCNPAAIHAKARELAPQTRGVWVVNRARVRSLPPGTDHVVAGTRAYYRALARARWFVNNVNWPNEVRKRPGQVHVMTHHGTPLKMMGLDQQQHPASIKDQDFAAQMRRADRWDFSVSANAHTTEAWERAYPCSYETLEVGYPRNDRLVRATPAEAAAIRERLGIGGDEKVLLYTPTHREWLPPGTPVLDVEHFADRLGPGWVVLVRSHYFYVPPRKGGSLARTGQLLDVSTYPVVEDLYLASDVLLTDYSSAMFDYAVLDRPIVIFAPDWAAYREVRGVYFDLMAEPPGAVATTVADLVNVFRTGTFAGDAADKARAHFRSRFCYLEDGDAAERVVRRVFLSEQVG